MAKETNFQGFCFVKYIFVKYLNYMKVSPKIRAEKFENENEFTDNGNFESRPL